MAEERTYRLEPPDTSGVFLGLGVAQSMLLGVGIFGTVLAFTGRVPVLVAVLPIVGSGAVCFGRVAGHPAWEWLPLATRWWWTGLTRRRRWRAPLPLWPTDSEQPAVLPPCLGGLEIVTVPWRTMGDLAAVADPEAGTLTAVIPVAGTQFPLAVRGEQERLLAGWGDVLNQFATEQTAVAHVSWSDLVRPAGLVAHRRWLDVATRPTGPSVDDAYRDQLHAASSSADVESAGSPPVDGLPTDPLQAVSGPVDGGPTRSPVDESYAGLLRAASSMATAREVVVTVTVARSKLGRHARSGGDGDSLHRALTSSVESLLRGLQAADLRAGDPLSAGGLHRLLRVRADPAVATAGLRHGRLADRLGLVSPTSSGPLALDVGWRHVRVDAAWHRTYWVASWPRLALPPCWLESFLAAQGVTRSMTVAFMPVPTRQSRRRIERDLVRLQSDADTKEQRGRRIDARHTRATRALLEREQELVSGFAEVAYVGLVTVTATNQDQLDQHAEIVEQHAAEVGMDLRVLDGRQDLAWAAGLPVGLAPRHLLAS